MSRLLRAQLFLQFVFFSICACTQIEINPYIEEEKDIRIAEPYQVEEVPIISDESGWDIPANDGIRNALLNAEQIVNLKYKPICYFNAPGELLNPGEVLKGMVYSSTRSEDLFCPNNVSLWTFMSSLLNPNSYLYTKDITKSPYSIRGTARAYYGQVCTQFVQYALCIKYNFQIYQMTVWDGFDRVNSQDIDKIRLGDVLTNLKGHTRMVTGIRREDDHVVEVAISESVPNTARRTLYSAKDIVESFADGYVLYRYRYINSTEHIPSPFISVGDEPEQDYESLLVTDVIPRRGDKANWRKDEPVILDVLSRGVYTMFKLFKEEELIEEALIPENSIIDLGIMPFGTYKLCLTNGVQDSPFVYWIVADYSITATAIGNAKVLVSFSSRNATPIWATWRIPQFKNSDYNNGPLWTTAISAEDVNRGMVVSQLDPYFVKNRGLGEWDIKVAFETDFGIISSDSVTLYVY